MSYARFDPTSDVYVYESVSLGRFVCFACWLDRRPGTRSFKTRTEMVVHLREHLAAGHKGS